MFLELTRQLRPTKSTQQSKDAQINFLLEYVEKKFKRV